MTNPILMREMKSILRSTKTFCLVTVYMASLCLLVLAVWPKEGIYSFAEGASQSILTIVAMGQLILVALFTPAFTATAIVYEKENQSFDMLFATLLPPRCIVTGKLTASIAGTLLIVFSALPISAVCFFLGGVGLRELAQVYIVLCVTAGFFGITSLLVSAFATSSHSALIWSYMIVLFLSVGVMIPYYILSEWTAAKKILILVRNLSPFSSMISVVQPQVWLRAGERLAMGTQWTYFLALAAGGTVLSVVVLLIKISRPPVQKPRSRDILVSGAKDVIKRKLKFPFYLIDPMKRKRNIGRIINPVFEKERRSRMFGNLTYIVRGMYACLIISLGLTILSASHLGVRQLDFLVLISMAFQLGIIILVVPSLCAGSITQEIETHNLEMLRMTPLRPWTIISGKIQYAMAMLIFLLISCAPIWFMLGYIEALSVNLLPAAAILGATVLFSISCGIACSAFSQRTSTATAVTYGIVLFVSVVTLLPVFLGDVIHRSARTAILSMNPLIASVQLVASGMFKDMPEIWQTNLKFLLVCTLIFLVAATLRMRKIMGPEK